MKPRVTLALTFCIGFLASPQAKADSAKRQEHYLVSATQLKENLPKFELLDVRSKDNFDAEHIATARWADLGTWTAHSKSDWSLVDAEFWNRELGKLGISNRKPVVVAGDSATGSARAWWLLKFAGVADVRLLDGGIASWKDESFPLTTEVAKFDSTETVFQLQPSRLAELADLPSDAAAECRVLDNRSREEFTGVRQLGARGGHIPGAIHLEWKHFVDEDNKYLSVKSIRQLLTKHEIDWTQPMVTHCQTGGRSSVAAFALEMAGVACVKNYYRGWSEYAGALTSPVAR